MKEKMMNNVGIKILALCIAFLLWIIIINIDDPVDTKLFNNIPVEILNEDEIQSLDQVYEVISGGNINVKVKAKRSVLKKLKAADISATADLSERLSDESQTNAVLIKLGCAKYDNVELSSNIQVLKISLEDIATEQFKVSVDTKGTTPESGYAIGEIRVKPNLIKVSGAQTQIDRISEVRVDLDVTGATEDFTSKLIPKVYDANGKLMDSSRMIFSSEEIKVHVSILETKKVPVHILTTGETVYGYQLLTSEYEPKQIEIAGAPNVLRGINEIEIEVDITGKSSDLETEISLIDYIPEGVVVVGDVQTITVKLTISKQKLQEITFKTSDIELRNLPENITVRFEDLEKEFLVKATSLEGSQEVLNVYALKPYIDCKDLKVGNHTVEISFDVDTSILVTVIPTAKVLVREKNQGLEENEAVINTRIPVERTPAPVKTEEPLEEDTDKKEEEDKEDEDGM